MITLTNHYPFTLDEKDASIDKPNTGDATVDGYIQTALLRPSIRRVHY